MWVRTMGKHFAELRHVIMATYHFLTSLQGTMADWMQKYVAMSSNTWLQIYVVLTDLCFYLFDRIIITSLKTQLLLCILETEKQRPTSLTFTQIMHGQFFEKVNVLTTELNLSGARTVCTADRYGEDDCQRR